MLICGAVSEQPTTNPRSLTVNVADGDAHGVWGRVCQLHLMLCSTASYSCYRAHAIAEAPQCLCPVLP